MAPPPPPPPPPKNFDELLTLIGTGIWNIIYMAFLVLHLLLQPSQALSGVFLAPWIDHTCRPHPDHLNQTIERDSCHYVIEREATAHGVEGTERAAVPCTNWEYDLSTITSSLTSDYDWVCDHDYLRALYQALYVVGTIVSPLVCGYLADRFGRIKILVATRIIFSISSISIAFLHNLPLLLFLRLITGFSEVLTAFVLTLEVCEPRLRAAVAILSGLGWSSGTVLWGGLAYCLREWRSLQLVVSLPTLLVFPLLLFMDESPRWLIVSGQSARAKRVLQRAARWNKATLPTDGELDELFTLIRKEEEKLQNKPKSTSSGKGSLRPRLFWNRNITIITLAISLCYFCVALVYDGITLAGDLYSDNLYLYMVLAGVAEAPGIILVTPIVQRFGRRGPMIICLLGCGVVNLAISFLQAQMKAASFLAAMAGKLLVTAAFQIVYLYSSELFPTEVRVSGVEGAGSIGQIGATLAPYFSTYMGPIVPWLPSTVYGVICVVTAITTMLLRETKDRPLPETIADLKRTRKERTLESKSKGKIKGDKDVETRLQLQEARC